MTITTINSPMLGRRSLLALVVLVFAFVWAYWTTLADLAHHWSVDPLYSHGYLVPVFACFLLWLRKDMLVGKTLTPSWWGFVFVAFGAMLIRLSPLFLAGFTVADRYSVLLTIVGICLAVGGATAFRWAWPAIAFLVFMIHLPAGMDRILAGPLQRIATIASTNALQTLGFFAESEANTILMTNGELNVEEACSGLHMLVTLCAMTTAVAMLMGPSFWRRLIVIASAPFLAVICNVARIMLTGIVQEMAGPGPVLNFVHDFAGWLMIVFALALLGLEVWILTRLFTAAEQQEPQIAASATANKTNEVQSLPRLTPLAAATTRS